NADLVPGLRDLLTFPGTGFNIQPTKECGASSSRPTGSEGNSMATAIRTAQICRNFINGQWVESRSGRTIERRNPANLDEVVAVVPLSTREEVREAIAAAKTTFPSWRASWTR